VLRDRLALPSGERGLKIGSLETERISAPVVPVSAPLAQIIAVAAEAANEEMAGSLDSSVDIEALKLACENRDGSMNFGSTLGGTWGRQREPQIINPPRIGPGREISSEIKRMGREPDLPRRRCS
jgi:hypothetical protein